MREGAFAFWVSERENRSETESVVLMRTSLTECEDTCEVCRFCL